MRSSMAGNGDGTGPHAVRTAPLQATG
jgi:hypothetical protein